MLTLEVRLTSHINTVVGSPPVLRRTRRAKQSFIARRTSFKSAYNFRVNLRLYDHVSCTITNYKKPNPEV